MSHPADRYAGAFCASGNTDQSSYSSEMWNLAGWCIILKTLPTVGGILLKGSHSPPTSFFLWPDLFLYIHQDWQALHECSGFCSEVRMCFCLRKHKLPRGHCCFKITELLGRCCVRAGTTCVTQVHLHMVDTFTQYLLHDSCDDLQLGLAKRTTRNEESQHPLNSSWLHMCSQH